MADAPANVELQLLPPELVATLPQDFLTSPETRSVLSYAASVAAAYNLPSSFDTLVPVICERNAEGRVALRARRDINRIMGNIRAATPIPAAPAPVTVAPVPVTTRAITAEAIEVVAEHLDNDRDRHIFDVIRAAGTVQVFNQAESTINVQALRTPPQIQEQVPEADEEDVDEKSTKTSRKKPSFQENVNTLLASDSGQGAMIGSMLQVPLYKKLYRYLPRYGYDALSHVLNHIRAEYANIPAIANFEGGLFSLPQHSLSKEPNFDVFVKEVNPLKTMRAKIMSSLDLEGNNKSQEVDKILKHSFWELYFIDHKTLCFRSRFPIGTLQSNESEWNHGKSITRGHVHIMVKLQDNSETQTYVWWEHLGLGALHKPGYFGSMALAFSQDFINSASMKLSTKLNNEHYIDYLRWHWENRVPDNELAKANNIIAAVLAGKGSVLPTEFRYHPHNMHGSSFCFGGHKGKVSNLEELRKELDYLQTAMLTHTREGQATALEHGADHSRLFFSPIVFMRRMKDNSAQSLETYMNDLVTSPTLGSILYALLVLTRTTGHSSITKYDPISHMLKIHAFLGYTERSGEAYNAALSFTIEDPYIQNLLASKKMDKKTIAKLEPITILTNALAVHDIDAFAIPIRWFAGVETKSREQILQRVQLIADSLKSSNESPIALGVRALAEENEVEFRSTVPEKCRSTKGNTNHEAMLIRTSEMIAAMKHYGDTLGLISNRDTLINSFVSELSKIPCITKIHALNSRDMRKKLDLPTESSFSAMMAHDYNGNKVTWLEISTSKLTLNMKESLSYKSIRIYIPFCTSVDIDMAHDGIFVFLDPSTPTLKANPHMSQHREVMHPYLVPLHNISKSNAYRLYLGDLAQFYKEAISNGQIALAIKLVIQRLTTFTPQDALFDLDIHQKIKEKVEHHGKEKIAQSSASAPSASPDASNRPASLSVGAEPTADANTFTISGTGATTATTATYIVVGDTGAPF